MQAVLALLFAVSVGAASFAAAPGSAAALGSPAPASGGALVRRSLTAGYRLAPSTPWRWPLDGQPAVVRPFRPPPQPWLPGHRGVDLGAVPGAVVRAAGSGVVYFAGQVVDRPVVSIDHSGGLRTTYEPVTPLVRAGQAVSAGDPIGYLMAGHAGCPVATCLHWGLRLGEAYLDPLSLFGKVRVRLLPLADPADRARVAPPA